MSLLLNGSTTHSTNNTVSFDHAVFTLALWFYRTGGDAFGQLVAFGPGQFRPLIRRENGPISFQYNWTGATGAWTFGTMLDNVWTALCIKYDRGALGNDPVGRVNCFPVTALEVVAPSGTVLTPAVGYAIGGGNPFAGRVAHVQFFDAALSIDDMDACVRRPGSVTENLKLWRPVWDASSIEDLSASEADETSSTGKATADDPPVSLCRPVTRPSRDYTAYPRQKVRESPLLGLAA